MKKKEVFYHVLTNGIESPERTLHTRERGYNTYYLDTTKYGNYRVCRDEFTLRTFKTYNEAWNYFIEKTS